MKVGLCLCCSQSAEDRFSRFEAHNVKGVPMNKMRIKRKKKEEKITETEIIAE